MKKKSIKRLAILLVVLSLSFNLIACGDKDDKKSSNNDKKTSLLDDIKDDGDDGNISDDDFETQVITLDKCSFEIPADWSEVNSGIANTYCYAPSNIDLNTGTSSVNIVITDNPGLNGIEDLKNSKDVLESSITSTYSTATNFQFDECSSNLGDALVMSYEFSYEDVSFSTTQYLILTDNNYFVVTASDINDGVIPSTEDVAVNLIDTIEEI